MDPWCSGPIRRAGGALNHCACQLPTAGTRDCGRAGSSGDGLREGPPVRGARAPAVAVGEHLRPPKSARCAGTEQGRAPIPPEIWLLARVVTGRQSRPSQQSSRRDRRPSRRPSSRALGRSQARFGKGVVPVRLHRRRPAHPPELHRGSSVTAPPPWPPQQRRRRA